ncbi:hypothetical protein PGT21_024717 [Puccinia graminis f. sp. tritici]|uniref:Uncharacterized protein n=1 Tax=Puccinia graminis f. sp. tritici TaxID=56615 RepID=A0A5B0NWF5_PUCGR|nr:hypothetical protein PGT21_024717 [Puccinia graminis f. sp. tritici]KAA1137601.1 hypothetical protein PGTUg99_008318 [Puccinia graminis f. sp. tritici]
MRNRMLILNLAYISTFRPSLPNRRQDFLKHGDTQRPTVKRNSKALLSLSYPAVSRRKRPSRILGYADLSLKRIPFTLVSQTSILCFCNTKVPVIRGQIFQDL